MKKNLVIILTILVFFNFLVWLSPVEAQITIEPPTTYKTFGELINAVVDFIFNIALVVAPIMLIIGGFYFVTAAGDPGKIKTAKDIIWYAVIGLGVVLLAKGLIAVLTEVLKGP